jgi:hypothetical protein
MIIAIFILGLMGYIAFEPHLVNDDGVWTLWYNSFDGSRNFIYLGSL